jgi:hypothetical protein
MDRRRRAVPLSWPVMTTGQRTGTRLYAMQPRRRTRMVRLPGCRLRTAGSNPLRQQHLRLSALLSARLRQRARGCGRPGSKTADRLRVRLGWEPGILNGEGGKPKWMRWRTFERLAVEHDALVGESLAGMALRFGIKF